MQSLVERTSWHGLEAWKLESLDLSVVMVPQMGAKIVSLFDRRSQAEWLIGAGGRTVRPVPYGALWHEQDMAGWDEMFPTIIGCTFPGPGAYHGVSLPDHGEAWTLPWQVVQTSAGRITLALHGQALPYQLERTVDCPQPGMLRLGYSLRNLGVDPLPYLWAAHPQFICESGGQVIFPPEVTEVINTIPESWGWGPPETRFGWPEATGVDGSSVRTDLVGLPALRRGRKFFALPHVHPTWAAVLRNGSGQWLRFEWDAAQLPYLGLWVDEGAVNHASVIAPEPTTAWYDDLALAFGKGEVKTLPVGGTHAWTLAVHLGIDGQPAPAKDVEYKDVA